MNVCRLRDTPIIGFVNKLDRDIRDTIELLDEIEDVLKIEAAPINWPIGTGSSSRAFITSTPIPFIVLSRGGQVLPPDTRIQGLDSDEARALLDDSAMIFATKSNWSRG